ncbi:MAG: sigma-70 family RNA polymerase sigma factor [Deltaproteobacteria bacterium]|nr:MAG: sigma-70 family RNA polymerase sigma factor [Deltaproteobacteria bacterium]
METAEVEALYRRYGPSVRRRARRILGRDDLADDAVQEVFVRVLKRWDSFRGQSSPMTWLYRITTNLCLNHLRDSARRTQILAERPPDAPASDGDPTERRLTVAELLAQVPEGLREIAVYYYVDQMSQAEIAELLGVSRRTVGNRLAAFHEAVRDRRQEVAG